MLGLSHPARAASGCSIATHREAVMRALERASVPKSTARRPSTLKIQDAPDLALQGRPDPRPALLAVALPAPLRPDAGNISQLSDPSSHPCGWPLQWPIRPPPVLTA